MVASGATDVRLAGRAAEVDEAVRTIRVAVDGRAGALLVSGEAGIGKTSLVRAGVAAAAGPLDAVDVVWAQCLPLTSLSVPFLPLAAALRDWSGDRDLPPPEPGASAQGGALLAFDGWLTDASRRRPLVLVVDDVHWADQSTLDVLMYVLAGRADRRLAVLVTVRTGDAESGPGLTRWLADVRRLPRVGSLPLGRLDRPATADQLTELLGRTPHQSLVDDVFGRSSGNPYLATLLVAGLSPDARHLDRGLPSQLRDAVLRSWQGLSAPAKAATRLLAGAGRPRPAAELAGVAHVLELSPDDLLPSLREAAQGRVVQPVAGDAYWFVHPLVAEVLEEELLPEDRRRLHAAFAALGEARLARAGAAEPSLVIDVADHHWSAGHDDAGFRWALAGAEAAERSGGPAEAVRLLARALDLLPRVADTGLSRRDLLDRVRRTAANVGDQERELRAVEDLLADLDPRTDPLVVAELLVRRTTLRRFTGREFYSLAPLRQALRLSRADPASPAHALATAELAHAELRHAEPAGAARAAVAVRLARACASPQALSYALMASATAKVVSEEPGGFEAGLEAQDLAVRAGDGLGFVRATFTAGNALDAEVSRDYVDHLRRGRERLVALGWSHAYVAWLSAVESSGRMRLGEWRASRRLLREALGADPGLLGDVLARLTASALACAQGRLVEAEQHLQRAEELTTGRSELGIFELDAVRAELAVARRDPEAALAAALRGVRGPGRTPTFVERLLPLAARGLSDAAVAARDRAESVATWEQHLERLRREHPVIVRDSDLQQASYDRQVTAMQAWYDAEALRGLGRPGAAAAWMRAVGALASSGLLWDEAYATYRLAEVLLPDRTARDDAARTLRRTYRLATDLAAAPLLSEVEALARAARIPLAEPSPVPDPTSVTELGPLTAREREVLGHLVAGRTYAEIARALVISEKTVSVHVSNLLRKTGTANRVELAQLAHRLAVGTG